MKKRYAVLLLAAVLLFTCSCGKAPGDISSSGEESAEALSPLPSDEPGEVAVPADEPGEVAVPADEPGEAAVPADEPGEAAVPAGEPAAEAFSISEIISEDGSFTDEYGDECAYSYHVPQLDTDTPDAAYINDVINTIYGDIVTACRKSIEQKIMPDYFCISWESCQNGSIVSIVIKTITYYGYYESYDVYNYDTEKDIQLFTPDLLAQKNISEDAYYNELRRTAVQYFDDTYFEVFSEWGYLYRSGYSAARGWTCSDRNIIDDTMAFLDADGNIAAVVKVGSLSEADYYEHIFSLDMSDKNSETIKDSFSGAFSATLKNGELTVDSLAEHETAPGSYHEGPYTVHGLYSNYTQVRCDVIEETGDAVVFLLTDTGRVEFVDVNKGLYYGYFCVNGPILGVDDIVSLEASMLDNGVETVVAVDGKGGKVDLAPLVQASEQSVYDRFLTCWSTYIAYETDGGGSYEDFCSLEIHDWDQSSLQIINQDAGTEFDYTGWFTFLGTSEAGCVYVYCFAEADGSFTYDGVASLYCEFSDIGNGLTEYCYWMDLSGTGIFGAAAGEELIFMETFG